MKTPRYIGAYFAMCLCSLAGCQLLSDDAVVQGRSPLQPARPSPDSVKMEIIWARFPAGDSGLNDEVWRDIDETQIEPSIHRELANNGLRAGVIRGKLPDEIARALNQGDVPPEESSKVTGETDQFTADPIVHGRVRQLPRHERMEIQASEVYASLPLLLNDGRELSGRTYQQAQAIYALQVDPQPDRTTRVELTPELHYGPPRMRFTGGDVGVFHQAPLRDRDVFDRLRLTVTLASGDMLVLMSMPDASSRLGHYFHTVDSAGGPQQKLILIRLAEVPPSDLFVAAD